MVFLINILIDYLIYYSKDTKELYDKGSNIVHGGSPINENSEINPLNIKTILQYSRDCILCCIILIEKIKFDIIII